MNYESIEFPVSVKDYAKLEWKNTININVFGYEKACNEGVLNLLLITEGEKKHYVLIKNSNSLMYHKTKHQHRKHFCMHCLQRLSTEEILANHKTNCMVINGEHAIRMPQKGKNTLEF